MDPTHIQFENEQRCFDPDEVDISEQQFAASLDASIGEEKPQFVLDDVTAEAPSMNSTPDMRVEPLIADSIERPSSVEAPEASAAASPENSTLPDPAPDADWRDQVSAKVNHYKARKPRQERYPSLSLQFDAPPQRMTRAAEVFAGMDAVPQAPDEQNSPQPVEMNFSSTALSDPPLPGPPPRILLEATARVLEFRRPASRADELADPVIDRPRIVEAPELLPPPPAMGGILIEPPIEDETDRLPGLDLPLQSSPFSRRLLAGAIDVVVVAVALAAFGYIFLRLNGIPPIRTLAEIVAALLAVLWPAYQYALLVYSKRTLGLWVSKLEVTRFDGKPASRSLRRWRVLASLLSCASLGLGYAWCFLDEDQLSWHDRITRTHLGAAPRT